MQTDVNKKLFTMAEYYKMYEAGIIGPDERTELIEGEIIKMSPMGVRHGSAVIRSNDLFGRLYRGKALVSVQVPIDLDEYNEPVPDLCLLKPTTDYYASRHAGPSDVFLVLEISDTTLDYDSRLKLRLYAAAEIPEYWIANLKEQTLLVFRKPSKKKYETTLTYRRGDSIGVLTFPEIVFPVEDLLGPAEKPSN
jgi:Uma2 family endonuclease